MGRLSVSKYKTGLYYKRCLYSGSPEWIVGCVEPPATCGYLVAAICINKAILKIDIAADGENPDIINQSLIQTGIGFEKLGISDLAQNKYEICLQSPTGTTIIPAIQRSSGRNPPLSLLINKLFKKEQNYYAALFDDSETWESGEINYSNRKAVSIILIDKTKQNIRIELDISSRVSDLMQRSLIQVGAGLKCLGLSSESIGDFSIHFQTVTGTTAIPVIKKERRGVTKLWSLFRHH